MLKIEVHSTRAVIRFQEPLTVGLTGAKVRFTFGSSWDRLIKTAVFRQGDKTVTVADIGENVTIPWEVLTLPGVPVLIGVYGADSADSAGTVKIPTLWAETEPVRPGADPKGDPSTESTPGLWEQMQGKLGSLEQLNTEDKTSLVAAINEANRPVRIITVFQTEEGTYGSDYGLETVDAMMEAKVPIVCYWYEKNMMLNLSDHQREVGYSFTAITDAVEYQVSINKTKVTCKETALAKAADLPRKVSDLENDAGFISSVPAPVYLVTISDTNRAEQPYADIVTAHRAGYDVRCSYRGYLLPLKAVVDTDYTFSGTVDTTSLNVIVRSNGNATVYDRPLAKATDLPQKVSDLENDAGYLTAAMVTVTGNGDGTYSADLTYSELRLAHSEGKAVVCLFADDGVYLPLTGDQRDGFKFSAVVNSCLYDINIPFAGGDRQPGALVSRTDLSAAGADGLSTTEKNLLLTLFENTAYINPDMGSTVQQLKKLWSDGTEEPSVPENTLAYWDYTMGDIRNNVGFSVNAYSPASASITMEEEGMRIVNNSSDGYSGFVTDDTFDFSTVEVTYVIRPIEIYTPSDTYCGIAFNHGADYALVLSTQHGVSTSQGPIKADYVLPSLDTDYTIKVSKGAVYVNDSLVLSESPTTLKPAFIAINGTMYLKSISVMPLEG